LLKYIVDEHNKCCILVQRINGNISSMFFVCYFISVPAIDILVLLSIDIEIDTFNRILTSICSAVGFILLFLINYSLSIVPKESHRPHNKLNSIVARKSATRLLNLKVLSLIEKLSGPVIGIYCLDLFPFTNFEFLLYISNCVQNFMLLIGLFK